MKKLLFIFISFLVLASPLLASAISNPAPGLFTDLGLGNDISAENVILFVISNILLPIVGMVSILFIMIGGFRYITARGDDEAAESGKKTLTNAVIGLVIVIVSYIIVTVVINALQGRV